MKIKIKKLSIYYYRKFDGIFLPEDYCQEIMQRISKMKKK